MRVALIMTAVVLPTVAMAQNNPSAQPAPAPSAVIVTGEATEWGPAPTLLPSGAKLAVLEGDSLGGRSDAPRADRSADGASTRQGEVRLQRRALRNLHDRRRLERVRTAVEHRHQLAGRVVGQQAIATVRQGERDLP